MELELTGGPTLQTCALLDSWGSPVASSLTIRKYSHAVPLGEKKKTLNSGRSEQTLKGSLFLGKILSKDWQELTRAPLKKKRECADL